jgi:hypothetical protein
MDKNSKTNFDRSQFVNKELSIKQPFSGSNLGLSSKTNKMNKI